ncbi:MAG: hypothetical protein ACR2LL_02940 [Nitrosopumilus sp.]
MWVGTADVFAVLTMTVILSFHYEFVMMLIVVLVGSFMIVCFVTLIHYIILKLKHQASFQQIKPQPFVACLFGVSVFLLLPEILSYGNL